MNVLWNEAVCRHGSRQPGPALGQDALSIEKAKMGILQIAQNRKGLAMEKQARSKDH